MDTVTIVSVSTDFWTTYPKRQNFSSQTTTLGNLLKRLPLLNDRDPVFGLKVLEFSIVFTLLKVTT